MEARKGRRSDRALRPAMRSPGRPPGWQREHRERFWDGIAGGLSSEDAGVAAGVSPVVGSRWFRENGGMAPFSFVPVSGRYLSFVEREEIAVLHARQCGVREIARHLGRSPSTISRELRRNAATRGGAWSIGPRPRSGIRIGGPVAPRFPSWPPTTPSANTFRIAWVG